MKEIPTAVNKTGDEDIFRSVLNWLPSTKSAKKRKILRDTK